MGQIASSNTTPHDSENDDFESYLDDEVYNRMAKSKMIVHSRCVLPEELMDRLLKVSDVLDLDRVYLNKNVDTL